DSGHSGSHRSRGSRERSTGPALTDSCRHWRGSLWGRGRGHRSRTLRSVYDPGRPVLEEHPGEHRTANSTREFGSDNVSDRGGLSVRRIGQMGASVTSKRHFELRISNCEFPFRLRIPKRQLPFVSRFLLSRVRQNMSVRDIGKTNSQFEIRNSKFLSIDSFNFPVYSI